MTSPLTRAVGLWVAQSLLAVAVVAAWLGAVSRAKRAGMRWPARWAFPWVRAWEAGSRVAVIAGGACAALYALTWWLARRA